MSHFGLNILSAIEGMPAIERFHCIHCKPYEPTKHLSWWRRAKGSWRRLRCDIILSSKMSSRHNCKAYSWRRLKEDVLQTRLKDVLKMTCEDVLKTSWRFLWNTPCKHALKTCWKTKNCYAADVLKTSWKTINVCWEVSYDEFYRFY